MPNNDSDGASQRISLPKLKSLIPENSLGDENQKKFKPTRHNNIRSSFNRPSLMVQTASKFAATRESDPVSIRAINHTQDIRSRAMLKKSKLPPLRRDFR